MRQSYTSVAMGLLLSTAWSITAAGQAATLSEREAVAGGPDPSRPRQTLSLVQLVEQASDSAKPGELPRISLVELVQGGSAPEPVQVKPTVEVPAKVVAPVVMTEKESAPVSETPEPVTPPLRVALPVRDTAPTVSSAPEPAPVPEPAPQPVPAPAPAPVSAAPPVSALAWRQNVEPVVQSAEVAPEQSTTDSDSSAAFPVVLSEVGAGAGLQLAEAVQRALQQHPSMVEALSRLDRQQEQVSVARAGYLPQLSTGINTGYRHTTGRSEEALTLSASQMLYDFGKVSSAVEAAERGVDREEAGVLLAAEDLIRDTAQAYIEAQRYTALLELAEQQIEAIGELEALAAKRSALGAATVSDEMQARSRREAARATRLQMQAQRDQWHRALENLIGSRDAVTIAEHYPAALEGMCRQLPEEVENAPLILMAEAERAEAEAAIRQARADQRPTLSLNADFEHYLDRDSGTGQQLDDQELVVRLNLTSNLFQGGALRARSRAATHAYYSASAARDRAMLELSRLYRETRDQARSLSSSLALQDERHASITRTQELYRHQYLSLGTRTLLDILNTEQEIFQTLVDKQNTLSDLRRLQIDCLYSVGGLRQAFRAGDALNDRVASRRAEERS